MDRHHGHSQPFHGVTCVRLARDCSPTGPRENSCRNQLFLRPAWEGIGEKTTERRCAKFHTTQVRKLKGNENCENEHRKTASFMYNFNCTENQCNQATLMAFYTNFATEFFHTVFTRRSVSKGTLRRDQKVMFLKSPISSPIYRDALNLCIKVPAFNCKYFQLFCKAVCQDCSFSFIDVLNCSLVAHFQVWTPLTLCSFSRDLPDQENNISLGGLWPTYQASSRMGKQTAETSFLVGLCRGAHGKDDASWCLR